MRASDGVSSFRRVSRKISAQYKAQNLQTLQKKMIVEANRSQSSDYNLKPKAKFPIAFKHS